MFVCRVCGADSDDEVCTDCRAPWCCEPDCDRNAEWMVVYGNEPDEYTHVCTEHIARVAQDGATLFALTA